MRYTNTRYLFILAAILGICGCQQEDDFESTSTPKQHTINASLDGAMTRTTFEGKENSYDLITKWQGHEHIRAYCHLFDTYSGTEPVKVSSVSPNGRSATFTYDVPDDWGNSESYDVVVFTTTCLPAVVEGKLYYNASLIREPVSSFQVPVYSEGEVDGNGNLNATFHHYYTYELLHIKNTSNEDISFTLLGFEEGTWFKQKGSLCIDDGQFVVNAPSTKDPVTTTTVTVKAQESETIVSAYIPTGQPIQMARMVAQVNGQDVKSVNTKSSGVELKQGHAYHMYAGWNGKELKFWSNEEAPLDVETRSATFDPATFSGLFTGAVTNLADGGVKSVGFRFWRDEDPEDYVEFDTTLADDNTFSLTLTYNEFLEIAGDASVKGSYNVSAFAFKPDGSRFHGDILEFTIDKELPDLPTEPTAGELIDLGLSVRWASHNVGATKPQEVGGFYAWGETETKSTYDWSNYALANGSEKSLKKYCTQSSYGTVDNRTTLESSDDAAYAASQGKMRMPTSAEWKELKDKCVWTAMKYEGRDGYLVASPTTGNAIFIPANGFKTGTNYYNFYAPYYWTSDLNAESSQKALMVNYIDQWSMGAQVRCEGLGTRPVSDGMYEPAIEVDPAELNFGEVRIGSSATKTVTVTNTGGGALTFHLAGGNDWFTYVPEDEVTLTSGESCELSITFRPQSATQTGVVYRVFSNASNGTKYIKCDGIGVESTVPGAVDLGLPSGVMWASCNLGASKPEEFGDYFAWGETEPKTNYSWSTYKWCNGYYTKLTKYCFKSTYWDSTESMDKKTVLDLEDDAARANWGGSWRMPTDAEWTELKNNSTWTWTTQNGVNGRLVTSNTNGNSIFLPAAGWRNGTNLKIAGSSGYYWSSSLSTNYPSNAFDREFNSDSIYTSSGSGRCGGQSVRPVYDDRIYPESVSINKSLVYLYVGDSEKLIATVIPDNASVKSVVWSSDNTKVVTVDEVGNVAALQAGTATITVTTLLCGKTATCEVMVTAPYIAPEAIDLGLPSGLKWASFNVGATKPEEYGHFFAWGETEPKMDYSWSTYKWCNGDINKLTKYCTNNDYWDSSAPMDNKTVLDLEDDAAHANWGGSWRMPTNDEWSELCDYCTWTWTTQNGVNGRLVTSNTNGNSIFLPAAGGRYGTNLDNAESYGYLWSSSLDMYYTNSAWNVNFYSRGVDRYHSVHRFCGKSVRPVTE